MNTENTIFSPAEILLPAFAKDAEKMGKWAVIACDQFTSDMEYWIKCRNIVGDSPSTYRYILPEAYLGHDIAQLHQENISAAMDAFDASSMKTVNGLIYLERKLPNGAVRHGLIGKIDLEAYDYSADSASPVRATEATVVERIPSRCAVRASAVIELPHILILIDDHAGVFGKAEQVKKNAPVAYDFDLMLGGGHVTGYEITDENLEAMMQIIASYEKTTGSVVYAMGDGNHSLAAAKAHWENRKKEGAAEDDPARYALCEITALSDDSLVFEPIYRLVKHCEPEELIKALKKITDDGDGEQSITLVTGKDEVKLHFTEKTHALTVGTLQNFLDDYIKDHPETECDYIHGDEALRKLSEAETSVGFLLDGMNKNELFDYVEKHGTLPRKTFSMGEAESKRYYLEARQIVK